MGIWIGLAHVRPDPGNDSLEGAIGAFVPVLALAEDERDYVNKVTATLQRYEFSVIEIDDIELFEKRKEHSDLDQKII